MLKPKRGKAVETACRLHLADNPGLKAGVRENLMVINIKSSEEFERLLDALGSELWNADFHIKLFRGLNSKIEKYERAYNQSPTFWNFTFMAHRDAAIFRLMRIYDNHSASLSLRNLLDTIKDNEQMFDIPQFRERLKGNPFVDSLASDARKPDGVQLNKDMEFVSDADPLVKKLIIWRNNLYAHRSAKNVVKVYKIAADHPLAFAEIEGLVARAYEIFNRYKYLFDASSQSSILLGLDDYEFVLTSLAARLEQSDRESRARRGMSD